MPSSLRVAGPGTARRIGLLSLPLLGALAFASSAQAAPPPVLLGTADSFAILGGTTITNTGDSVINGDLGLHPGTAVTGFPPGTLNGVRHVSDAVAQQAKTSLTTGYQDAAGRASTAATAPDIGGRTLTAGVYRTGSVASLGLTGKLTLDAEGDPDAVFIFQIESTLVTAADSSVSLVNGAQACNVYWQVGSSATLGARTAFKGTILALTSISLNDAVVVRGRLLARNGAVTLINDTVTRSQCAVPATPEPGTPDGGTPPGGGTPDGGTPPSGGTPPGGGTQPGGGTAPGAGTPPGGGTGPGAGAAPGAARTPGARRAPGRGSGRDVSGPLVQLRWPGEPLRPLRSPSPPPAPRVCTTEDFTARVNLRDPAGIRSVNVFLDGELVRRTSRTRFSLRVEVRGLRVGSHRIKVVARDRKGNVSVTKRQFGRCALALAAPRFTG